MAKELIAGVSFADTTAQITVLEIRNGEASVIHLEEFKKGNGNEFWFLEPLLTKSRKIFKKVSKVSVALDHAGLFLYSFPMDSTLSQADQQEHVKWELSNYIRDFQPQDSINDLHVLKAHAQEQVVDLFVVSAKRSMVNRLQSVLADQKYELHVVDTYHFGCQYSLLVNYPEVKTKSAALVVVNENRIDVGILHRGRLNDYHYAMYASTEEIVHHLQGHLEHIPNLELFFCGNAVTKGLLEGMKTAMNITAQKLNPFRRMPVEASFDDFNSVIGQEHRYASCVGVALRRQ